MDKKVRVFLFCYIPALLAAAFFLLDRISPFTFPTPSMLTLNLLPLAGTYILLPGVIAGAIVIWLMGERVFAGRFLMAGIIANIVLSVFVCNVFRAPVLTSLSSRYGRAFAAAQAEESGVYVHPFFRTEEHLPGLARFTGRQDENIIRRGFMEGYKGFYKSRYPELIDRQKLLDEGAEKGHIEGLIAGRRANVRGEPFLENPIDASALWRLETDFPADFVEGYISGYRQGWIAGFNENIWDN